MATIRFQWQPEKTIQAIAYLVDALRKVEKVKLMKLLYIADRDHFLAHGAPVTGDRQVAMPLGPVPSHTLDLLDGGLRKSDVCFRHLHQDDVWFTVRDDPGRSLLSGSEMAVLDAVLSEHGDKYVWDLVDETHRFPEYREVNRENTSTPIPYETMLMCYETGNGMRFRHDRPVVSRETVTQMDCPYPAW